jgi:hypothetical protein
MLGRLGLVTAGAVLALAVPTTAQAATQTLFDGGGDMWEFTQSQTAPVGQAPQHRIADIVRSDVRHTATEVVLRTEYRALDQTSNLAAYAFDAQVRTNEGVVRRMTIEVDRSSGQPWAGIPHFTNPARPGEITCRGLSHHVDYVNDTPTVRIPRSCLSAPRWVRVNIASRYAPPFGSFFRDNAHNHQATFAGYSTRIAVG